MIRFRRDAISLYRLFFTLIFLSLGGVGLAAVYLYLQHPALIVHRIPIEMNQPLWMSVGVGGTLSLICGLMSGSQCFERRQESRDRRRRQIHINFKDRRTGIDRRTGREFHYSR